MLTNSCCRRYRERRATDRTQSVFPPNACVSWKPRTIAYNNGLRIGPMSESVSSPTLALPTWRCILRKAVWITVGSILLLLAILIAPHFVDLGYFKRTYLPLIEESLNRRLDVGEVRLRLVPTPSIQLSQLKIFDNAPFADHVFFSAEQVRLRLKLLSLLRGQFDVTELILDRPAFNVVKQPDGTFNYTDIANKKSSTVTRRDPRKKSEISKPEAAPVPVLLPKNISVNAGQINFLTQGQHPAKLDGIDLTLRDFSSDAPFPFRASFSFLGLNTVTLEGQLNYHEEKSILELKNNHLKAYNVTFPVEGQIANPFTSPRLNLSLRGTNVEARSVFEILSAFGFAQPDTEISGPMDLFMSLIGPSNSLITQGHGIFKNVKVSGKRALKGNLSGEVSIRLPSTSGPVSRRLQGEGKFAVRDGQLTNVDLVKKVERVTGMIGLTKTEQRQATSFKTMETDFILRGGYAEFSRLYLLNPQLEVNGSGTMTLDHPTLDLAVSTALSPQASARAGHRRASTFFKDKQGRIVVPLKIDGPVENPSVNLNAEKLIETGLPQNAEKGYSSFFKRLFRR